MEVDDFGIQIHEVSVIIIDFYRPAKIECCVPRFTQIIVDDNLGKYFLRYRKLISIQPLI